MRRIALAVPLFFAVIACNKSPSAEGAVSAAPSSRIEAKSRPATPELAAVPIALPGGNGGIGFDDLRFSSAMKKLLAPAGCTGQVALLDPATGAVHALSGFRTTPCNPAGHDDGPTSADAARGLLAVSDRTSKSLHIVDLATEKHLFDVPFKASPDYVRWVGTTEIWVTEPDAEQIEVFQVAEKLDAVGGLPIASVATIKVPGGPESIAIDALRKRAYVHEWKGATVAIDLKTRAPVARWTNGCDGARGIALDEERGFLFVGCKEGKAVSLDVSTGQILGEARAGDGVDVIDYAPARSHLYLPGAKRATMAILAVAPNGALSIVGSVPTAQGAHCVAADDQGQAWVCDPRGGRLLRVNDTIAR